MKFSNASRLPTGETRVFRGFSQYLQYLSDTLSFSGKKLENWSRVREIQNLQTMLVRIVCSAGYLECSNLKFSNTRFVTIGKEDRTDF